MDFGKVSLLSVMDPDPQHYRIVPPRQMSHCIIVVVVVAVYVDWLGTTAINIAETVQNTWDKLVQVPGTYLPTFWGS